MHNNSNWRTEYLPRWFIRKGKKLLWPYCTFGALSVFIVAMTKGINMAFRTILHMIILDGSSALWYLPALLFAEGIFVVFMKGKLQYQIVSLVLAVAFSSLYSKAFYMQIDFGSINVFINEVSRTLIGYVFVVVGYYGMMLMQQFRKRKAALGIIFILAMSGSCCFYDINTVDLRYSIVGNPIVYYCTAICGTFLILMASKFIAKCQLGSTILTFYGRNSIIIFATHLNLKITTLAIWISPKGSLCQMTAFLIIVIIETVLIFLIHDKLIIFLNFEEFVKQIRHRKI